MQYRDVLGVWAANFIVRCWKYFVCHAAKITACDLTVFEAGQEHDGDQTEVGRLLGLHTEFGFHANPSALQGQRSRPGLGEGLFLCQQPKTCGDRISISQSHGGALQKSCNRLQALRLLLLTKLRRGLSGSWSSRRPREEILTKSQKLQASTS